MSRIFVTLVEGTSGISRGDFKHIGSNFVRMYECFLSSCAMSPSKATQNMHSGGRVLGKCRLKSTLPLEPQIKSDNSLSPCVAKLLLSLLNTYTLCFFLPLSLPFIVALLLLNTLHLIWSMRMLHIREAIKLLTCKRRIVMLNNLGPLYLLPN